LNRFPEPGCKNFLTTIGIMLYFSITKGERGAFGGIDTYPTKGYYPKQASKFQDYPFPFAITQHRVSRFSHNSLLITKKVPTHLYPT